MNERGAAGLGCARGVDFADAKVVPTLFMARSSILYSTPFSKPLNFASRADGASASDTVLWFGACALRTYPVIGEPPS